MPNFIRCQSDNLIRAYKILYKNKLINAKTSNFSRNTNINLTFRANNNQNTFLTILHNINNLTMLILFYLILNKHK